MYHIHLAMPNVNSNSICFFEVATRCFRPNINGPATIELLLRSPCSPCDKHQMMLDAGTLSPIRRRIGQLVPKWSVRAAVAAPQPINPHC